MIAKRMTKFAAFASSIQILIVYWHIHEYLILFGILGFVSSGIGLIIKGKIKNYSKKFRVRIGIKLFGMLLSLIVIPLISFTTNLKEAKTDPEFRYFFNSNTFCDYI